MNFGTNKNCPACGRKPIEPAFDAKSTKIDFACSHCGAQLTLNANLPVLLTLACAFPCVLIGYVHLPTFTFMIGDGLIVIAFGLGFWPLRSIVAHKR